MELEDGEIAYQKERTSDSIQDFQNLQSEMETQFRNAKTEEAVKDSATGVTITSKSLPNPKNTMMSVFKKEKHQKESDELSSSAGRPVSSVLSHAKEVPGSDRAMASTQNSTESKKNDLQPSLLGKSLQTIGGLSSITIPMRLDALAYLLNYAVLNPCNAMPRMPCFANPCNIATCRNVDTSLYGHIPLTCCPYQGRPTSAVDYSSIPIYLSQPPNSTNTIYPTHTGYNSNPVYSAQSQNYNYCYQAVANKEISLNADSRWENLNSSLSSTNTTKWDDPSRPMQTFETSCAERCNSSFNQARGSFTRNDFRSTSVQGSSGNWRSSQHEDCEWQERNLGRSTGKFYGDSRTRFRRGGSGNYNEGNGFGGERSFGSDSRNRKRKEEKLWSSGRELVSAPKQVRWPPENVESSRNQRVGQSGSMLQQEVDYMGEKSRHKFTELMEKGKTSVFARKQITPSEDWDAEYDTQWPKSRGHEGKLSGLQQTKCQNRPTYEDWETDYCEIEDSKQETSLQPAQTEDKIINDGKGELDKKCQSSSLICVQSCTSSEVGNIFKIMEKDVAITASLGVYGEAPDTTDLHAITGPGDSDICQRTDSQNHLASTEPFATSVADAIMPVKHE